MNSEICNQKYGETTTGDGRSPLEAQVSPRGLVTVMQQRYHTPRHPKSVGRSQTRQRAWRNSATASGRNSFDSAEQPVPLREAASSVPRHSSDSDTGFGQYNPQSGDCELCHRAKLPPPVFKAKTTWPGLRKPLKVPTYGMKKPLVRVTLG